VFGLPSVIIRDPVSNTPLIVPKGRQTLDATGALQVVRRDTSARRNGTAILTDLLKRLAAYYRPHRGSVALWASRTSALSTYGEGSVTRPSRTCKAVPTCWRSCGRVHGLLRTLPRQRALPKIRQWLSAPTSILFPRLVSPGCY
jgi:hypothetical protein